MKKIITFIMVSAVMLSCTRNAITGRNQLSLFPESTLQQEAVTQYRSFLSENKVISASSSKDAEMVKRVGTRLAAAIKDYYTKEGKGAALEGYNWEFNLVDSKEINAWCMPGGKVVVYTGLLAVTQNEAALAIVLGHEITHAIAGHSNERMSQVTIAQGLQVAGNIFTQNKAQANAIFNNVYGPAAQVGVLLPNSRKQEYEADHYGLIFAAMAGYNPKEAIPFWKRMAAASQGNAPPEFLSSHPADANRIAQLEKFMPEALKYYKPR
ncbi:MAG: peptidase M48 [Niastella sp. SCN 39-18]|nr:M48 family metallopeptidase [Sphingobacteriales bacterium]ODT53415.1 MAG: peptidase M48 [Niastella sp. SCN 39-18]OJW07714.1 MAG: peptidase M48 [Sphingobacteriales bacterium 39-19]